ncbi:MAG: hypothetical protein H6842_07455 [Rhodospirillaceae bacterium]|nr:hypothetical protein [Rhodospirillaceae bacterium]
MWEQEQIPSHLDDFATAFVRLLEKIDTGIDTDDLHSIVLPALRGSAALCEAGLMREQTLDALWQSATGALPFDGGELSEKSPKPRLVAIAGGAYEE